MSLYLSPGWQFLAADFKFYTQFRHRVPVLSMRASTVHIQGHNYATFELHRFFQVHMIFHAEKPHFQMERWKRKDFDRTGRCMLENCLACVRRKIDAGLSKSVIHSLSLIPRASLRKVIVCVKLFTSSILLIAIAAGAQFSIYKSATPHRT